ncbi:hypothetical protein M9458_045429, partial [Cirrhinus mrigala]
IPALQFLPWCYLSRRLRRLYSCLFQFNQQGAPRSDVVSAPMLGLCSLPALT